MFKRTHKNHTLRKPHELGLMSTQQLDQQSQEAGQALTRISHAIEIEKLNVFQRWLYRAGQWFASLPLPR